MRTGEHLVRWKTRAPQAEPSGQWRLGLWPYVVTIVIAGAVVADNNLAPTLSRQPIAEVKDSDTDSSMPGTRSSSHWVVVRFADGSDFQTDRSNEGFAVGDTLEVARSPWFGEVVRYRFTRGWSKEWLAPPSADRNSQAFPVMVLISALLLLIPWRKEEARWILHAFLFMGLAGWMFNLVGTGILRRWL